MRLLLLSVAVLLLISVLTVAVIVRRNGRTGEDLLASQMGSIADPQPARRGRRPRAGRRTSTALPAGVDGETWRRIGELAVAGRRVQAIELLRTVSGCRITEAKAVVDQLTRQGTRPD